MEILRPAELETPTPVLPPPQHGSPVVPGAGPAHISAAAWLLCGCVVRSLGRVCLFCDPVDCSHRLCPQDSPGKNTGLGHHCLLQGVFPTQGSNPSLLYWQADSLPLSHQGSPSDCFMCI